MTLRHFRFIAVGLAVIVLAGFALCCWKVRDLGGGRDRMRPASALERPAADGAGTLPHSVGPAGKPLPRAISLTWSEILSTDQRRIALSMEEVVWMRRHGYLTDAEMSGLRNIDTRPLRGTRDRHLATLHGMALKERGELLSAASVLESAAAMGSIYGYEEAAISAYGLVLERFGPSIENDDVLRARFEVARILGDYKVDYLINRYLADYPMQERSYEVQTHVTTFLEKLGEEGQLTGLPAPGPDPRPNEDAWRKLQESGGRNPEVMVSAYVME